MGKKILTVAVTIILFTALVINACALTELAKGSKGDEVVALQEALANQGYLNGKADGDFGKMTEAAVMAFQKANGLPETGIADEATQSALQSREQDRLTNLILSSGSTGSDVTKLQNRLIELGFLVGKASGTYDVNTEAAMVVFQSRNGLTPNGVADKAVRDVLYADDARGINDPAVEVAPATIGTGAKPSEEELSGSDPQPSETSTEMVTVKEFGFVPVNGYYYYSVILHNNLTDMAIQFPEIRITARSSDGALISADSQVMNVMYPDQELVWAGLGGSVDEIPASIDIEFVEPTDNWHVVKPSSLEHAEYQSLEVKSARIKQDNLFPAVIGEIYNPNPYDLSMAAVTIIFRDEQGNLLAGDTGFVNGLKAEKTTAFEINVSNDLITDNFEVYGQPW